MDAVAEDQRVRALMLSLELQRTGQELRRLDRPARIGEDDPQHLERAGVGRVGRVDGVVRPGRDARGRGARGRGRRGEGTEAAAQAAAGGVGGLAFINVFQTQPLDMLTLLGFVILVGIVVNNAILIVHQTLFHLREEGMDPIDAIEEATRNRIRPIFMSTLTSVMGMLPLVVFPGEGSELYRGLGAVVVGGLSMSAFLTLLTVPPLLRLCIRKPEARAPSLAGAAPAE